MKITSVTVSNFGPFYGEHTLRLDPCVTILTGPNDCGKSILLDALACAVSHGGTTDRRVNLTRAGEVKGNALADPGLGAEIVVEVSSESAALKMLPAPIQAGDVLTARRPLGVRSSSNIGKVERAGKRIGIGGSIAIPRWDVLRLPGEVLRPVIPLKGVNAVERGFLELGLGPEFVDMPAKLPNRWPETLRRAEESLTDALRRALPSAMEMEVRLTDGAPQNVGSVRVSLVDAVGELIGVDDRGAGLGRMLAFVGPLVLALRSPNTPILVLIDEPENSLHADLQHKLRMLLEEIGKNPMCQVVYATHSPSMINNMRPGAIRLLGRGKNGEAPTSIINNDPYGKNFAMVRSALGITPADSLLYAPVTVVVEGKTEAYCLPRMLQKLKEGTVTGFNDVDEILGQIHFLDGEGDSVEFLVRLAKSQNSRAVVWLDGERRPKKGEQKLRSDHSDVPIIKLDDSKDIEQLVPGDVYFRAIVDCCREDGCDEGAVSGLTPEGFGQWLGEQKQRVKENVFGRQVQDWLEDALSGPIPPKHKIMGKAVELCPAEKIECDKLSQLLQEIRRLLGG